ncbi:MAG: hypothetical protein OEZ68_09340 [Gammaproteobacteria bacterium]|nr:hypothetical protein [Gammaproteobacteria bacterium]MDH5800992.1 hypothetical protein [Gammaproteobacteria bacterium]
MGIIRSVSLVLMLVGQACTQGSAVQIKPIDSDALQTTPISQLTARERRLAAAIGKSIHTACESHAQCKTVAQGFNPCGGVGHYRVYSTATTDVENLQMLLRQYNQINSFLNKKMARMGACVIVDKPATVCVANQCVTRSPMLK